MLPKLNRLDKDKDFKKVFAEGRSKYDKLFGVKCASNRLNYSRIGILVGIKTAKKAVDRNLLKRKIRESVRELLPDLAKGYDIVIIALPPAREKSYQEIKSSLEAIIKSLKLIALPR